MPSQVRKLLSPIGCRSDEIMDGAELSIFFFKEIWTVIRLDPYKITESIFFMILKWMG